MKIVILLLILLTYSPQALPEPINSCDPVIQSCKDLIQAQDDQVRFLRKTVSNLESQIENDQSKPILPEWLVFIGGIVVGGILTRTLSK